MKDKLLPILCKLLSGILALTVLSGLVLPGSAAEDDDAAAPETTDQTVMIQSTEDFLSFAKLCALDTWSLGKTVVLQTDISLSGTDFSGIPTFGGVFDGGGHTISGLSIGQSVAPAGLFRNLQPTAEVKRLTVSGRVTPGGDAVTVGGIVGENYGTLENCAFSGTVEGTADTGGIAGRNYGIIRRCKTSGAVTGDNRTGGIAGFNEGTIAACENSMDVNVDSVDPTIDPTSIDLDFNMDLSRLSSVDTTDAASDTGGIAGYSAGTILSCSNTGAVGYPHIGYNLGGIVGRNSGFVSSCQNEGLIQGRKDVGGIAGQIEPEIATILSPDYLETLSKQFKNLGNLVSAAGSHAAGAGDEVQSCIQEIVAYQSSARSALDALASGLANSIEDKEYGAAPDADTIRALGNSIQGMVNATNTLRGVVAGSVEDVSDDASAISGQLSSISRTFALATEDAKQEAITDISDVDLSEISEGKVLKCTNSGIVSADLNVGGIAGIMGMEDTVDPEDDAPGGSLTLRRRYELKAIVQDCVNTGTITGKRSYVGGICGRMELGLITSSQGFGTITSESGDYVGGIAGMTGGTIRGCFTKCTLSGGSYIGGIVGCGIAEDYSGESSTVSGCYSMVCVDDYEQYIGSIAGGYVGNYTGNYFVSDTLQGINDVSYFSLAEPISYAQLRKVENLPDAMRQFTLSFVTDGETIKTLTFDYGDSFDFSVFPEIPQKEGYYAQWSTNDLTDLRFDTVVEVEYIPHITALSSTNTRSGGKPMLFVQGRFKDGDVLSVAPGTTGFFGDDSLTLLEQWQISIPADGLENHSIRYLPTQENTELYLLKNGSWSRIRAEEMGSYLVFDAAGAELEIAVVSSETSKLDWPLLAGAGALAVLLLAALVIVKKQKVSKAKTEAPIASKPKKHKKKKWLWVLLLAILIAAILCAAGALLYFPRTQVGQSLHAFDILKTYLEQPEREMRLTVNAQIEDKSADFTADIASTMVDGTAVSVVSEGGRRLYFADGIVFLENGDAFQVNGAAPDYSELPYLLLDVYKLVELDAADGIYTVTAEGSQATAILKLLLPSAQNLLPEANRLTVDLITENNIPVQIQFSGAGNLTDSVKTPFSLSATVDILPVSGTVTIPNAVTKAVSSADSQPQELYSDDLVYLIKAWSQIRGSNPITTQITIAADCGPLTVSDSFRYYQWRTNGNTIHAVDKDDQTLYFTDSAACDASGKAVSADAAGELDATQLLDVIYQNFRDAEFQCRQEDNARVYTVSLSQAGMKQLWQTLLPQAAQMRISHDKGKIQLRIEDGQFQSIRITCGGSSKVIAANVEVQLSTDILFLSETPAPVLPEAVKEALLK